MKRLMSKKQSKTDTMKEGIRERDYHNRYKRERDK